MSTAIATDTSAPYVGRWHGLVSTTNWQKGKIISDWRTTLQQTGIHPTAYSDETWSQLVGGVTAQHVGRLRRVHERFGDLWPSYEGLYWSHFLAAIEWDDAEMWLEGAIQNSWSVSQMRRKRWETLGGLPDDEPRAADLIVTDVDEDYSADDDDAAAVVVSELSASVPAQGGLPKGEARCAGDAPSSSTATQAGPDGAVIYAEADMQPTVSFVQPFADLDELPVDFVEAFESFKLAILRHKDAEWADVSRADVLASLESLKSIVMAP